MDFLRFWGGNFLHGGEAGETLVYKVDFACALLGVVVKGVVWWWREMAVNKHSSLDSMEGLGIMAEAMPVDHGKWEKLEKWWDHWENKFVTITSSLALVTFLFTAIAVAPYHRYEHSEKEKSGLVTTNETLSNRVASIQAEADTLTKELKESERRRQALGEDLKMSHVEIKQSGLVTLADIQALLVDQDKKHLADYSSNNPGMDRLLKIASTPPLTIALDKGPINLETLRKERQQREVQQKQIDNQRQAQLEIWKQEGREAAALARINFSSTVEAFIKNLSQIVSRLLPQKLETLSVLISIPCLRRPSSQSHLR